VVSSLAVVEIEPNGWWDHLTKGYLKTLLFKKWQHNIDPCFPRKAQNFRCSIREEDSFHCFAFENKRSAFDKKKKSKVHFHIHVVRPGLPDGIFWGLWMPTCVVFHGHGVFFYYLEYAVAIWKFVVVLCIFFLFGILYRGKSGNPVKGMVKNLEWEMGEIRKGNCALPIWYVPNAFWEDCVYIHMYIKNWGANPEGHS
jgi:hypothetical protein